VIPLRYGAGIKGKLVRTLANGVPSVATTLAVEGMELEHERQVLVADAPKEFARAVVRLFHRRSLWYRLQEAGYSFAEERYSWEASLETLNRILDVADATWIARRTAARANRLAKFLE
jgi:glycosyltransferase involved in cell wall biosynthesis